MADTLFNYLQADYKEKYLPQLIDAFDKLHLSLKLNADKQAAKAIKQLLETH
jgi:hypothetical protein